MYSYSSCSKPRYYLLIICFPNTTMKTHKKGREGKETMASPQSTLLQTISKPTAEFVLPEILALDLTSLCYGHATNNRATRVDPTPASYDRKVVHMKKTSWQISEHHLLQGEFDNPRQRFWFYIFFFWTGRAYQPNRLNGDTILLLETTCKHLLRDGQDNLWDEIVACKTVQGLRELARHIDTALLRVMKASGGRTVQSGHAIPSGRIRGLTLAGSFPT